MKIKDNKGLEVVKSVGLIVAVVLLINTYTMVENQNKVIGRIQQNTLESAMDEIIGIKEEIKVMLEENKPHKIPYPIYRNSSIGLLAWGDFDETYTLLDRRKVGSWVWLSVEDIFDEVYYISEEGKLTYKRRTYLELANKVLSEVHSIYVSEISAKDYNDYRDRKYFKRYYLNLYVALDKFLHEDENYIKLDTMDEWFDLKAEDPREIVIEEGRNKISEYLDLIFDSYEIELTKININKISFDVTVTSDEDIKYTANYRRDNDSIYIMCDEEYRFVKDPAMKKINSELKRVIDVFNLDGYKEYGDDTLGSMGLNKKYVPLVDETYDLGKSVTLCIDRLGRITSISVNGVSREAARELDFISVRKIENQIKEAKVLDLIRVRRENGELEYRVTVSKNGKSIVYIFDGVTGELDIKRPLVDGLSKKQIQLLN